MSERLLARFRIMTELTIGYSTKRHLLFLHAGFG